MAKNCTAKAAAEYMREWSGLTAVKGAGRDAGYMYFTAKDSTGAALYIRVSIQPHEVDNEFFTDIESRDDSMNWQILDSMEVVQNG